MPAIPGRVADTWVDGGGGGSGGVTVHDLLTGRSEVGNHPLLIPLTQKGAANGVATLDGGTKIPAAQIPAIALSEFLGSVASEAAMLALVGQRGDWCVRTDLDPDSVFMLESDDPTQAANWTNLTGIGVVSVDGQTGAALIVTQTITNGVTNRAPSEDAVSDALALKATLASPTFTGDVIVPDADAATEALNRQTADARYPLLIEYPGNGDNYQPDAYPAAPTAENDEFEGGGALDAKWGWSSGTVPTLVDQTTFPGFLFMQVQAAESALYLRQAYVPGAGVAFTIAARVCVAGTRADNASTGIGIAVLNSSDVALAQLSVIGDGAANMIGAGRAWDGATAAAIGNGMSSWVYIGISRDTSNVYRLALSHDGIIWNTFGTLTTATAVARIGLWLFNGSGTADRFMLVDWFRRFPGSSFPFVTGR